MRTPSLRAPSASMAQHSLPRRAPRRYRALGGLLAVLHCARAAFGCAACAAGDPVLAALGTEQPYPGRLRSSLALGYRELESGRVGVDALALSEYRADLSLAWAPGERAFLLLLVPLLDRRLTDVSLAEQRTRGLGDVELRGRVTVLQDRSFAPRQVLHASAGLGAPTAVLHRTASGQLLPSESQLGTGSLDGLVGAAYSLHLGRVLGYLGAELRMPWLRRQELEPPVSLRGNLAFELQILTWLRPRLALDARWQGQTIEQGQALRDSGGAILFVGPDLLLEMGQSSVISGGVRVPLLSALSGQQRESPSLGLGISVDWR
jgi:hypothetical protein